MSHIMEQGSIYNIDKSSSFYSLTGKHAASQEKLDNEKKRETDNDDFKGCNVDSYNSNKFWNKEERASSLLSISSLNENPSSHKIPSSAKSHLSMNKSHNDAPEQYNDNKSKAEKVSRENVKNDIKNTHVSQFQSKPFPPVAGGFSPVPGSFPPVPGSFPPVPGSFPPVPGPFPPVPGASPLYLKNVPPQNSHPSLSVTAPLIQNNSIVEVPLINQTVRRNRIIEVPEVHVIEKIHPKIQIREVVHKVPRLDVQWIEKVEEIPEIRYIDKHVEIPDVYEDIKYVKKVEYKEVIREVPKYEIQYVPKYVEVPQVKCVLKYVEVPEIREIKKYVEKPQIVEIPYHKIKKVPKIEIKKVEKIRYVDGPIEYIDIPVERVFRKPVYEIIEKIKEVPEIQEIVVETPCMVPTEGGPVINIPVEVPVFYDVPKYKKIPGKIIPIEKEKIYEKIVEKPVPVPQETLRVIKVPHEKKVEILREVEVPRYIDEIVHVPKYIPVVAPPPIIMPIAKNEIIEAEPIYEQASPRYVYEPPVYAPPVFEKVSQQVAVAEKCCNIPICNKLKN